ncbi:hypothetical protein TWF694_011227 [Orbilia ellipsospora]|uniref:F-box domain-containing protein n=1 Tax=Orbilia ellipsospora TaxID=2528407 RepID=A0AAV9X8X0_9PEZI
MGKGTMWLDVGPWDPVEYSSPSTLLRSFAKSYAFLKRTLEANRIHEDDIDDVEDHPLSLLVTVLLYLLPRLQRLFIVSLATAPGKSSATRWLLLAMDVAPLAFRETLKWVHWECLRAASARSQLFGCRLTLGAILAFPKLKFMSLAEDAPEPFKPSEPGDMEVWSSPEHGTKNNIGDVELAPELDQVHRRFLAYDPLSMDKLHTVRSASSVLSITFSNDPGSLWPTDEIIRAARKPISIEIALLCPDENDRELMQNHVKDMRAALLEKKETIMELKIGYHSDQEIVPSPYIPFNFSSFENLESLFVSLEFLMDVEAQVEDVQIENIFPLGLETLSIGTGSHSDSVEDMWEEILTSVLKGIAVLKDSACMKLREVDVKGLFLEPYWGSEEWRQAKEMMQQRGITLTIIEKIDLAQLDSDI